jgi:hypothetical protein
MGELKITSWNIKYLDKLMVPDLGPNQTKRLKAIAQEIQEISPDILCIIEGPAGPASIDKFASNTLSGMYVPVKAGNGAYSIKGNQWIWFLVKTAYADQVSLLPTLIWDEFAGKSWKVNYWGDFSTATHRHYRHPQVMIWEWQGQRVEFIGLHLKSKFVSGGKSAWKAGGERQKEFISKAIKARVKMSTEAANVRSYINAKFKQVEKPAIFVMGDLNDGPGKEYFETRYLFFDLLSNIQGDVFFARKFLNHALFDYPDSLRWSAFFKDFVDSDRDPKILLDHILFTQGLVDGSLPLVVEPHAGLVEHEIHDLINASLPKRQETSDHKPVSLTVTLYD